MAACKIVFPSGRSVRTASQRRYVVVAEHLEGGYIVRRSDGLPVARAASSRHSGSRVYDTVERAFI